MDENTIQQVWNIGQSVYNNDTNEWRKDECGAWIYRLHHGNRNSQYGWEVDHVTPSSSGGSDSLSNLRPLQWENNLSKQDGRLVCVVTASDVNNVRIRR